MFIILYGLHCFTQGHHDFHFFLFVTFKGLFCFFLLSVQVLRFYFPLKSLFVCIVGVVVVVFVVGGGCA